MYCTPCTARTTSQRYNLRHRAHSLQLPEHSTQLPHSHLLTRMLYKNTLLGSALWFILFYFSRLAFLLLLTNCICFELLACILWCHNERILIDWLIDWLIERAYFSIGYCDSQSDISSAQRPAVLRTRSMKRLNAENNAGLRIIPLPSAAFIAAVDLYLLVAAARFRATEGASSRRQSSVAGSVDAVT